MGSLSLLSEPGRAEFIRKLDSGIINEGVISQATTRPFIMLSLFHDLESPLFKQYRFDAKEFLEGVAPALQNFHNVSGSLENQYHKIRLNSLPDEVETTQTKTGENGDVAEESKGSCNEYAISGEDKESVLSIFRMYKGTDYFSSGMDEKEVSSILNHDWAIEAKRDPESLAAQLSRMLTCELFQVHQISAKTAFLLQNHERKFLFREGSCCVNNVALLSARAKICVPADRDEGESAESRHRKYQPVDYAMGDDEMEEKNAGVAAQIEVLYDVTHSFVPCQEKSKEEVEAKDSGSEALTTTIVSVATIQGWLKGGPEGELRWQLALHRPAFEFPGIQNAY